MAQTVTVFGGTGFLGRRIVRHLHDKGFSVRIASRRPNPSSGDDPQLRSIAADIYERSSVARAVAGAFGVVNAVNLYVERGTETFDAMHVRAAERLYPVHVMTRKSFGLMTRKLSVTESQRSAQFPGTFSRRKLSVASANWAQVA